MHGGKLDSFAVVAPAAVVVAVVAVVVDVVYTDSFIA